MEEVFSAYFASFWRRMFRIPRNNWSRGNLKHEFVG
jgi:hypothetical protein